MTKHILMCEPEFFRIAYEINPWMRRANQVAGPRALEQWLQLEAVLKGLGVTIELVRQDEAVPDMTFTANAGIAVGRRFIPSNFRHAEREPEEALFTAWFQERGYEVATIHEPHYWEGEGDVLPSGSDIMAGYRFRTEERALDHLDELLDTRVVRLELADPRFYHLDTCLCPLGGRRALYFPPAFTAEAQVLLAAHFDDLIEVPEAEALRFACNALNVEGTVVLNSQCPQTEAALAERGFRTLATPTDEFIKAGGSVKCLTLMLDAFDQWAAGPSDTHPR